MHRTESCSYDFINKLPVDLEQGGQKESTNSFPPQCVLDPTLTQGLKHIA